ncbi:MAG: DnaA regulatory inactivator Hda [Betaproteobacteria bacterium]|nr:DnaA regulatory inactivator Hda [Betaproteobacteria bacterium]
MRQLNLDISPQLEPTFESFVTGANAELVAMLRQLAAGALAEPVFYLWGERGSGRSHLLNATLRAAVHPARLLLADDVDTLDAAGQSMLFNRINAARETGAPRGASVLACGSAPPAQLALRDDLKSRLAWGLVYQVKMLDDTQKAAYLRDAAARRGLRISEEIVAYLLTHVRRDLPSLVVIIAHLDDYSLSRHRPVTLPLVREALARLDCLT